MKQNKPVKTALMKAVDLLARQEQSKSKLREKLKARGYAEAETEAAIEKLEEKHYLNDTEACKRQFAYLYNESRLSVKQIELKLRQRGFTGSDIREALPADIYERELTAAKKVLRLKFRHLPEEKKLWQTLYSKGFDSSVSRVAIEEFIEENAVD